jgi:GNAT superfamily N-acetyltransferase
MAQKEAAAVEDSRSEGTLQNDGEADAPPVGEKNNGAAASVTLRPGTPDDVYEVFVVFEKSLAGLLRRLDPSATSSASDPVALARMWEERRTLYEHLAQTAEQFWVAEQAGQPVGFARSILRDGVRELTELFVSPDVQSAGVGRQLLARAFPTDDEARRVIIASPDPRALVLYLRVGVYPRTTAAYFGRDPEPVQIETDLEARPVTESVETLATLAEVDRQVLGFRRDADHRWLLGNRQGILYIRQGQAVGYGYVGARNGPFALLNEQDFPAVLAQAESAAAEAGREFGLEVPLCNRAAVDYLLGRRFRMDNFLATFLSDRPFDGLENYILTSPPFFM